MFPPGLEPGTFRVLGERDNHYTTETWKTVVLISTWTAREKPNSSFEIRHNLWLIKNDNFEDPSKTMID